MIRVVQNKLIIPRGDTGTFSIPVSADINTGDIAYFTIIDYATHSKVYEQKIENIGEEIVVNFSHEDTVKLPIGRFLWDIKIYSNPQYDDNDKLIDADEVHSIYGAYRLPYCEIRETGDNLPQKDEVFSELELEQSALLNVTLQKIKEFNKDLPSVGGNYILKVTMENNIPSYHWAVYNGESSGNDSGGSSTPVQGIVYVPSVSSAGVISWSNNGGQQNPQSVDLVQAVINALPSAEGVEW